MHPREWGERCFLPPPCKSSFQRALLLSWLAGGRTRLHWKPDGFRKPRDVEVLLANLERAGAGIEEGEGFLLLETGGFPEEAAFELEENGTALRCLCACAALRGGSFRFEGGTGLGRRPLGPLLALCEDLGVDFVFEGERGRVPFSLRSPGSLEKRLGPLDLGGGTQGATGLLFARASLPGASSLEVRGRTGYLELSLHWLSRFGQEVRRVPRPGGALRLELPGGGLALPEEIEIPADPSSAAWMLCLAAGLGRSLCIEGLDPGLPHPDLGFPSYLEALGLETRFEGGVLRLSGVCRPRDLRVGDLEERPDAFPPLVALCSALPGRHSLGQAPKLRLKESDRIALLAGGLAALGFEVEETGGGLDLRGGGGAKSGRRIETAGDHRIYMAFRLMARFHGLRLELGDPSQASKSWPGFEAFLADFAGEEELP